VKVVTSLSLFLFVTSSFAVTYTGSLEYSSPAPADSVDEIQPTGNKWPGYDISISWTVTDEDDSNAGFPWLYSYTFSHSGSQAGISHIIIESSPGFTLEDMTGLTGASLASVGLQSVESGNSTMPEDLIGIRFNPLSGGLFSMSWSFYSSRAPVWGDFYARDGGNPLDSAYNFNNTDGTLSGFLDPNNNNTLLDDIDPSNLPAEGNEGNSYFYHILRPDTSITVPEPAITTLLLAGGLLLARHVKKRRARP